MPKLKECLVIAFMANFAASNIQEYKPRNPLRFAQQIFWDSRTNVAIFVDSIAAVKNPSIFQFDWETKRLYETTLKKSSSVPSFCVPSASDTDLLICGFTNCTSYVSLPHLSPEAVRREDVSCRSPTDSGIIDRAVTLSDGLLLVSLHPGNCDTLDTESAAAYLDLKRHCYVDVISPGFFSNGFAFDSKTNTLFMADDCLPAIVAYKYDDRKKTFSKSRIVYRFVPAKNFPSGLAVDQCGNLYVGEQNKGRVYYIDTKSGKLLETIKVPGTHVSDVAIVGPKLDHLAVVTGIDYTDTYGNNQYTSSHPGDGKLYLIPLARPRCLGTAGTSVADV
ncbi:uncharacterized protein LOC119075068 [Bradysia coprophila]|uniref:uncharacterized protein LOC119075068 n=1 Tax=Bradysia coprophila TaxID=38358 RepID=UPI00187DA3C3|nr:uncharacterized protein LOC119075068 [Bradysia coprophila]